MASFNCTTSSSLSTLGKQPLYSDPFKTPPHLHHLSPPISHFSTPPLTLKALKPSTSQTPLRSSSIPITSDLSTTSAPQSLKSHLKNGETLLRPLPPRLLPHPRRDLGLGHDFVVVDMEHDHGISNASLASTPRHYSPPPSSASKSSPCGPRKPSIWALSIMFP
ncbi:hypothetical protein LOK49_LG11G02887 [Camellia lanceoleosa]|uniref:Uncharacterized protein n=1 Tax=Camellia lanceoleosa TaxID=1840588 RepID=A0ACC0FY42_9ERIC|nr:hypothetical protein LOK49_LG11G02887 [Camellia lanceoleosa]